MSDDERKGEEMADDREKLRERVPAIVACIEDSVIVTGTVRESAACELVELLDELARVEGERKDLIATTLERDQLLERERELHGDWCHKEHETRAEMLACYDGHIRTCVQLASDNGNEVIRLEGVLAEIGGLPDPGCGEYETPPEEAARATIARVTRERDEALERLDRLGEAGSAVTAPPVGERLDPGRGNPGPSEPCRDSASNERLAGLEADNARMREALEPFAQEADGFEEQHPMTSKRWEDDDHVRGDLHVRDFRLARAALAPEGGGAR